MDFTKIDPKILARQLSKPEGKMGEDVGKMLAEKQGGHSAFVFEFLQLQPADHVLEIGFGPGEDIAETVRLTPKGYVAGIDYSDVMLKMAQERNHRAIMQEHVELILGDAKDLPYADGSFDKIFCLNVFHFWREPLRELAECLRVLKSGGRLVVYLPHPSHLMPGMSDTGLFIAREPEEVASLFTQVGFRNVDHHLRNMGDVNNGKSFIVCGTK